MKITFPSFLLLFILTTAINAQQKIGFKIILDQNFKYNQQDGYENYYSGLGYIYNYYNYNYKRNSKSYGLTYEKVLSNKFLTSIETGLYLNNQSSSCISSLQRIGTETYTGLHKHTDYFSGEDSLEQHTYTLKRKITEFHIPILIKKYFYIKSAIFFVSAGPKLALTLSDKTSSIDTEDNSILMKRNNFDKSSVHPSRFYLINTLNINLGFEYKKAQISTSYALFNIRNLHKEINKYNNNSDISFLLSLSIGYTL